MREQLFKCTAALAVFAALAVAQTFPSGSGDLVVSIPFEFTAADKVMPAGEYIIHKDSDWALLHICEDGVDCAVGQVRDEKGCKADAGPELVFHNQGGRFSLSVVRLKRAEGYRLPECPYKQAAAGESAECDTDSRGWRFRGVEAGMRLHRESEQ